MPSAIYLIRRGDPSRAFEIRDLKLNSPQDGEVLIQVEFSGLNYADVMARLGLYPEAPPMPAILGYEVVGRVAALGPNVRNVTPGQRVLAFTRFGGYASHVLASSIAVVPIPEQMDGAGATALGTQYCTAYYAAEEMVQVHPGDHVLVQAAAGGVGTALVQILKHRKAVVYGTAGSEPKLEYLRTLGVDHPINYRQSDFAKEVLRISGRRRLDVVFDSLGGSVARKSFALLGPGGRLVCYGVAEMSGNRANIFRTLGTLAKFGVYHPLGLLTSSRGIIGVNMLKIADARPDALNRCLRETVKMTEAGVLRPHVSRIFPAEKMGEAHAFLANRSSVGKVVVKWSQ